MTDTMLWIILGFAAAIVSTIVPLTQDTRKVNGFAFAVWVKITVVALNFPLVMMAGWPDDSAFYTVTAITSLLWAISDVVYFSSINKVGAGVVSRTLPIAGIISFPIWFLFDPALLDKYLQSPIQSASICIILLGSAFFALQIKKCPVSLQGLRLVWFVLFAAIIGPLIEKLALGHAAAKEAPVAFACVQGGFMILFWGLYAAFKKPISGAEFISPATFKPAMVAGVGSFVFLYLRFEALRLCEHPALLTIILMTDALWILLFYRAIGKKDDSKIWAGLGIVGCAAALALVKSL
jgi:hypothetical protein